MLVLSIVLLEFVNLSHNQDDVLQDVRSHQTFNKLECLDDTAIATLLSCREAEKAHMEAFRLDLRKHVEDGFEGIVV